ncbi:probable RNA-dependent RNA polymerase 1 [Syzygium oleosum]|uniref:probable RNA-dependent RNA polymerase 1 n=1 Tax=Syzygium oleosum TaxID=219896 RepID=UPI0011D1DA1B|nr:probable RNA-dependent RNA polymerase 1 [Syzygium oleosum]XP_030447810.1 probable RNA-dependent RNA polymerase 1 [Syzygium oleosum]XP_030447811.1 probable RNA-dependent RNA polymerase 1 [Syzygium oleosum]
MGRTIQLYGFPSPISAKEVKDFLEQYLGKMTVYAVEILKPGERRTCAHVQFTAKCDGKDIISLANNMILWYGNSYLKAWERRSDIVPNPKVFQHCLDNVTLHFGCQTSEDIFTALWESPNASVKFGFGMRKLLFFLTYNFVDYKLELSYENIGQIELHQPRGQTLKYLVIQLLGAPRIYEKDSSTFKYFMAAPDDQWVRQVDFTPSFCIGQSSCLCLELCHRHQLPDFDKYLVCYKEQSGQFTLEWAPPCTYRSDLVPIVLPPAEVALPFGILFKVCSLVQHGYLPWPVLDSKFFRLVDPRRMDMNVACIEHALEKLGRLKDCCYHPVTWLEEQYRQYLSSDHKPTAGTLSLDDGLVYVRRVQVTPSKMYFCGPEVNVSNRVLRNYPGDIDNFLRVSFVDEELDKIYSTNWSPRNSANDERQSRIYKRIVSTLRDGIVIGDKRFEFLAFSTSQLRESSVWMFASREGLTAADIREWMGDFRKIRNVAKYAARLGQSFSSSTETLSVRKDEVERIPDVETMRGRNKYVFSDGIGKISHQFAVQVARKCGLTISTPSAFQIRYGGFKGVVAVDPTSSKKLSLRSSMLKYESSNTKLDVLAWSRYQPCFLNRQIITLLSTLGVKDHIFERKQREALCQLDAILTDPLVAQHALELMSPGENIKVLLEMLICGYEPDAEPFLSMMLRTFCASKVLDLRAKARIFVPDGRSMMGCFDETRTLEYGQVFVQLSSVGNLQIGSQSMLKSSRNESSLDTSIFQGKLVVAKNPCLHPGDVRVLEAVDVPSLHHMVDCIVFPQKGKRPHPNECSGSDLDGDLYFVCWDPDLVPSHLCPPMDYTPAPTVTLDRDVIIEEVVEYFADYMVNNSLGVIANSHTVFADKEPMKAYSKSCTELAKLFSIAVDFPKTGVPAKIPGHLRVREYPDFMEKSDKCTYESQHVIGKLYREVKGIAPYTNSINSFTREVALSSYDCKLEVQGFEVYVTEAFHYKLEYDCKLRSLMHYYDIKTEAEMMSGNILTKSKYFDKKRDLEGINSAVRSLRKEARSWFNGMESGSASGGVNIYAKASAWYHVTYHPEFWGRYKEEAHEDHFLSFPWCVYDELLHIKRERASIERLAQISI